MKKLFILMLCLMAVLAIVSCKQDPKTEPTPTPKMTDEDVLDGKAFYRLTATREAKRFALQYYDAVGGTFDPVKDDVLTLKYRTDGKVTRFYLRDSSQNAFLPEGASNHDILDEDDPYVTGPDEDGWYTFTYTFIEETDPRFGFRLELADYSGTKFQSGQYLDIKDLKFKGEKLTIEEDEETEAQQSNHGVWNASNTDHTLPTLEILPL